MRLFVGIPAADELRAEIARWRAQRAESLPVRFLPAENLHVTLLPPWEARDSAEAAATLATIAAGPPFQLAFTLVEFGPPRAPRLIWARSDAPAALMRLRVAAGRALGHPIESRPVRLHLTIARFRPEAFARLPLRELHDAVRWRMDVREIVLFASHREAHGARYEAIERAALALY